MCKAKKKDKIVCKKVTNLVISHWNPIDDKVKLKHLLVDRTDLSSIRILSNFTWFKCKDHYTIIMYICIFYFLQRNFIHTLKWLLLTTVLIYNSCTTKQNKLFIRSFIHSLWYLYHIACQDYPQFNPPKPKHMPGTILLLLTMKGQYIRIQCTGPYDQGAASLTTLTKMMLHNDDDARRHKK